MRAESSGDAMGSVSVGLARPTVLELRFEGHGSRASALRCFERASEVMRESPEVRSVIFNLAGHVSHDPGNTALAIQWFARYRDRLRRVALATRSHSLSTLAGVGKVMLPWLDTRVFATREEAIAWCESPVTASYPAAQGERGRRPNIA